MGPYGDKTHSHSSLDLSHNAAWKMERVLTTANPMMTNAGWTINLVQESCHANIFDTRLDHSREDTSDTWRTLASSIIIEIAKNAAVKLEKREWLRS